MSLSGVKQNKGHIADATDCYVAFIFLFICTLSAFLRLSFLRAIFPAKKTRSTVITTALRGVWFRYKRESITDSADSGRPAASATGQAAAE